IQAVLAGGDRFFRAALADEVGGPAAAPVLQLLGVAATPRGDQRVHDVRVQGVDARFFGFAPGHGADAPSAPPAAREAFISQAVARGLGVGVGDTFIVRVERPSAIPRDLALAPDDNSAALRVEVKRVLDGDAFGEFALDAAPGATANVFVDLAWLQREMQVDGRANLALLPTPSALRGARTDHAVADATATLQAALERAWTLDDASLHVEDLADGRRELVTRRIFFDQPVSAALDASDVAPLTGVFTYFVNGLEVGGRTIPYSMVAALGALGRGPRPVDPLLALVDGLADDEVRLNAWAMADLGLERDGAAGVGAAAATVTLDYYVVDASRKLVVARKALRLAGVTPDVLGAPLEGSALGRELMPDFPGLADADHCREWEPGTPVDLDRIRDVDEAYWDDYRGTPKAFVTLAAGRALWSSRFGELTGARFLAEDEGAVLAALRGALDASSVGLLLRDVRGAAQRASESPTDFGGLFIGLSFFLLVAALLLSTQLFLFGVEARARELGLLGAVGFRVGSVRRIVMAETACVAAVGAALGAPLGLVYTRAVLRGLDTLWADAVARTPIQFHATAVSVALGGGLALLTAFGAAAAAFRGLSRRPALRLLESERGIFEDSRPAPKPAAGGGSARRSAAWLWGAALVLVATAGAIALGVDPLGGARAAGAYFGGGAALMAAVLCLVRVGLGAARADATPLASRAQLGVTNATRRRGQSFGTITSMALGVFLVLAVGANRLGATRDVHDRSSGTGGFAFYGRTSLPLLHDLATEEGRAFFGLDAAALAGASFVRMRVRDGDDASCLNLARPGAPRLLGVDPEALASRHAFSFTGKAHATDDPWLLLSVPQRDGAVPAIGDATSLTWQLKVGVGDTLDYVDERGAPFQVRIVAALSDTILQGDLLIAEAAFEARFPGQSGYRRVLVDFADEGTRARSPGDGSVPAALAAREDAARAELTRGLADIGLALERTGERLDAFHAVQNTYLSIFQALGALGLLVGSVGLGLLVLRNTAERRGELALLSAIGFRRRAVVAVIFTEYGALLAAGLVAGAIGAALAMVPAFASGQGSLAHVALLLAAVAVSGALWILIAVALVSGRAPAQALRTE
ncbi:MAG: ABC transporter permease, partial [Planctomycetota bacterium]